MRRLAPLVLCALLVGCAAPPLGEDFASLDPAAREERAVEVLRELFAERVVGADGRTVDLAVTRADRRGIAWTGDAGESQLRWADVLSVSRVELPELPGRPENLLLALVPESPSTRTVRELSTPVLAAVGLAPETLRLQHRPNGSRFRLLAALEALRPAQRTPVSAPARAPSQAQAPEASIAAPTSASPDAPAGAGRLDALELELRRLKEWREKGLITEDEHARARQALLQRLADERRP